MSKIKNWNTVETSANYVEPSNCYNNIFAANIKREPGTVSPQPSSQNLHLPVPSTASSTLHLENYIKHHQQQFAVMDTNMTPLTPSPHSISEQQQQIQKFFASTGLQHHHQHYQQMMQQQQQQFQQHFQQAQQAAAQNQVTSHLPLGFNPLTPPGLPQAVLPTMSHFCTKSTQQSQISSPQLLDTTDKSALTPRPTPPMDVTPPKSPKVSNLNPADRPQQDQELVSNFSEELKSVAESEEDDKIRQPVYNSHGKMKNYKCKSCGKITITKIDFWQHARVHMKPEKMLECNKCPFVTELKHHLEYHTRKHKNLKPFQCDSCSYTCVNKSMLKSHRKSHSSIYPYRCTDCDYVTKYCHSFKLHLRKYEHNPGVVLDEEGVPDPSVVIDVYGTRRGPKNKRSSGNRSKRYKADSKTKTSTSQLAAALRGFPRNSPNQMPASPANSSSPAAVEMPNININTSMSQQRQQQQQQQLPSPAQMSPKPMAPSSSPNANMPNLLPPLATLLQQNHNMAFLPYWNINLQMLAAQQQVAVLAQLSPHISEQFEKQQMEQNLNQTQTDQETEDIDNDNDDKEEEEKEEEEQELEHGSVDSAMDLSQGTPSRDDVQQQQTPAIAMNLKMADNNDETPLVSNASMARRKGRVLKLDHEQMKNTSGTALNSAATSPAASSPVAIATPINGNKIDEHISADESMETEHHKNNNNPTNTSSTSTASSSGNSSNSSANGSSGSNSLVVISSSPVATPTMYECRYCDIYFKDPVLYTIHMGYHSCDDVFKCNMCGEKCDGPVELFVHMARNAHS